MRDIIFRGKDVADDVWRYGDLITLRNYTEYCGIREYMTLMGDKFVCDKHTIGQFTGLTDKNGTKIFEGDILQFDYIGSNLGVSGVAPVIFQNGKFGVLWGWHKDFVALDGFANVTMTVIGNVHDNPELLNKEGMSDET